MADETSKLVDELPRVHASFRAEYLHAMRKVLDLAGFPFGSAAGFYLEPFDPGVLMIATDGHVLAVIHDKSGFANIPFKVLLPKSFREKCAPPAPLEMFCEGPCEMALPEWCHPGKVHIAPICACICPQVSHPAEEDIYYAPVIASVGIETSNVWRETDYRAFPNQMIDWRQSLKNAAAPAERIFLSPHLYESFEPVVDLARKRAEDGRATPCAEIGSPFKITISGLPEFVGAIMPMKEFEAAPVPDFLRKMEASNG